MSLKSCERKIRTEFIDIIFIEDWKFRICDLQSVVIESERKKLSSFCNIMGYLMKYMYHYHVNSDIYVVLMSVELCSKTEKSRKCNLGPERKINTVIKYICLVKRCFPYRSMNYRAYSNIIIRGVLMVVYFNVIFTPNRAVVMSNLNRRQLNIKRVF